MTRLFQLTTVSCAALGCIVGLSSCHFLKKNFSFVSDSVRAPQEDQVTVEESGGAVSPAPAPVATATSSVAHSASSAGSVLVQSGDTLSAIARRHGVALSALCSANGLTPDAVIRPGQRLSLPSAGKRVSSSIPAQTHSVGSTHKVKSGETLGGIAARHHTTVSAILKANGMRADQADKIRAGQVLRLPGRTR